jgi:hypothetical protein
MISPEEYIEQRLNDQIGWYDRKSVTNQRWFRRLRFAEIVAAATIPFLSGFAGNSLPIKIAIGTSIIGKVRHPAESETAIFSCFFFIVHDLRVEVRSIGGTHN